MASSVDRMNLFMFGTQNKVNSNLVYPSAESIAVFASVRVNSGRVVKCFLDDTMSSQRSSDFKHTEKNCVPLKSRNKRSRSGLKKANIEVASSKQKARKDTCRVDTVPGTNLKVCSCGTIAGNARSKKCRSCHKFFYDHWRKIPRCPKCNLACKNHQEEFSHTCLRCGFEFVGDLETEEKPTGSSTLDTHMVDHTSISEPTKLLPTVLNIFKLCDNQPEKNTLESKDCESSDVIAPCFVEPGSEQPNNPLEKKIPVSEVDQEVNVNSEEGAPSLKCLDNSSLKNVPPCVPTSSLAPLSLPCSDAMSPSTSTQAVTVTSPDLVLESGASSVVSTSVKLDTAQATTVSATFTQANLVTIPPTENTLSEKLIISNSGTNDVIVTDSLHATDISLRSSCSNKLHPISSVATAAKHLPVSVFDSTHSSSSATFESCDLSQPILSDYQEQGVSMSEFSPSKVSQDEKNCSNLDKNTRLMKIACASISNSLTSRPEPLVSTEMLSSHEKNQCEDKSFTNDGQHRVNGNQLPTLEYLLAIENPLVNEKPNKEVEVQELVAFHNTKTTHSTKSPSLIFPTIVPCESANSTTINTKMPLSTSSGKLCHQVSALPQIHVPSITKIKELVGLTIKQPTARQQQYLELQQKILSKQIKTQLDIQHNFLKRQNQFEQNSSLEGNSLPPPKKPKIVLSDIVADVIQSIKEIDASKWKAKATDVDCTQSQSLPLSSPALAKPSSIQPSSDPLNEISSELHVPELLPAQQALLSALTPPTDNLPQNYKIDCPPPENAGLKNPPFRKIETTGKDKIRQSFLSQNFLSGEKSSREQIKINLPLQNLGAPAGGNMVSFTNSAKKQAANVLEQGSHPDPPVNYQVIKDNWQDVKSSHPMPPLLKVSSDDCFMWPDTSTQDEIVPLPISLSESPLPTSTASSTSLLTSGPSLSLTTSVQSAARQGSFPITATSHTSQTSVTAHSSTTTQSALSIVPSIPGFPSRVKVQVCSSNSVKTEGPTFSSQPQYRPVRAKPTASIGGVLVQSLGPNTSEHSPLPKLGSVYVSVLGSSTPPVKNQEISKSECSTIGNMSWKSPICTPAESNRQQKNTVSTGQKESKRRKGKSEGGSSSWRMGEDNNDEDEEDADDKRPRKRKRHPKAVLGKAKKCSEELLSVKLKDGFFHHVMWGDKKVVFIVPLVDGQIKSTIVDDGNKSLDDSNIGEAANKEIKAPQPGSNRKTRRKAKLEPMIEPAEIEEELDPLLESPSLLSSHITTPCLSVNDVRHKLLSFLPSNTIYAYTYRHQIKTVKPPMHWHQLLRVMGAVQVRSIACRLLEYRHVQQVVEQYGPECPIKDCLNDLSRNKLPKGRQVIDLSHVEPSDLMDGDHFDKIPLGNLPRSKRKPSKETVSSNDVDDSINSSKTTESREQSLDAMQELQPDDTVFDDQDCDSLMKTHRYNTKGVKRRHCSHCGTQLLKKAKKCYSCGKRFGQCAFGRKSCPSCGHCNLSRMVVCHQCGHNLSDAPLAIPSAKDANADLVIGQPHKRVLDDDYNDHESGTTPKVKKEQDSTSAQSSRVPSTADLESSDGFPSEQGGTNNISSKEEPTTPTRKTSSTKHSKFSGYQYGRIPWGEADVTCLIDETGTPRFCLPELCSKVLRGHSKSDVFEIVMDLDLPLIMGDSVLLKKMQALGLHSNRSPVCRLIGPEEVWTLFDALRQQVPLEVHQYLETITTTSLPLMSPGLPPKSPTLIATSTKTPGDDEEDFESTLHEVECSDRQTIAILRTWKGEQYGSLTELWRKYFPEVNRNNLTGAIRRLKLSTIVPTAQQATLLRNANVISLRGAAGRLMKLEEVKLLLDDLGIPLQIGTSPSAKKDVPSSGAVSPVLPSLPPPVVSKRKSSASYGLGHTSLAASAAAQGKVLATKTDLQYAECMRNLLQVVDLSDIKLLVEKAHQRANASTSTVDTDNRAASLELDDIQQRIASHRELCSVLTDEIGFLNVSNHGFMSEAVRLAYAEKNILQDIEKLCNTHHVDMK